jgi:hypothetical protein
MKRTFSVRHGFIVALAGMLAGAGVLLSMAPAPAGTQAKPQIPRLANGKPDFTGVWDHPRAGNLSNDSNECGGFSAAAGFDVSRPNTGCKQVGAGPLPLNAAGRAAKQENAKFDQGAHCWPWGYVRLYGTPFPHAYVHHPDRLMITFEQDNAFKAVPTDGRKLAGDLPPTWRGTSVGHWESETLVIETAGFNGKAWLDSSRNPNSDALKVTERMSFIDANHINWEVTIEDPKYYERPFKNTRTFVRMEPGEELYEYFCHENNRCEGGNCTPSDLQK